MESHCLLSCMTVKDAGSRLIPFLNSKIGSLTLGGNNVLPPACPPDVACFGMCLTKLASQKFVKLGFDGLVLPIPVDWIAVIDLGVNECVESTDKLLVTNGQLFVDGCSERTVLTLETVDGSIRQRDDACNVEDSGSCET
jgi:hypothetical protein